jgi:hypothetical protein
MSNSTKDSFSLVTAKDVNQDNMSFGILFIIKHPSITRGKAKNSFMSKKEHKQH